MSAYMSDYTFYFLLTLAVVAAIYIIAAYNRLIALSRRCDQAFADIDVQMKQRHDLIPSLVETVRGVAGHERTTLEAVIKARGAAVNAATPQTQMQAENMLTATLGRLMALTEAYPQLQATRNFTQLQDELSDIENKIAAARRFLNNAVSEYNATLEQMPTNLVAGLFGLSEKPFFDLGIDRHVMDTPPAFKF